MARRITRDLQTSVTAGDRIPALEAMRDLLARRLEATEDDRSVAPLSKRLSEVMAELESLRPPKVRDTVDDLATKRAERRSTVQDPAPERVQRRGRGRGPAGGSQQAT